VAGVSLALRVPLKVDVIRDRASLSREVEGGEVENIYRLQIMNTLEQPMKYELGVGGITGAHLVGDTSVELGETNTKMITVRVRAPGGMPTGSHKIVFDVTSETDKSIFAREKSVFLVR
jgi:polyferredoxin